MGSLKKLGVAIISSSIIINTYWVVNAEVESVPQPEIKIEVTKEEVKENIPVISINTVEEQTVPQIEINAISDIEEDLIEETPSSEYDTFCVENVQVREVIDVPYSGDAKPWNITYMNYTAVTKKDSPQYKLLNAENSYTDQTTGIRMVDGRYCIALGTGFNAPVGTKVTLVTDNAEVPCIVGDIKADNHTDISNMYCLCDGSVVEFIVDKNVFEGSFMYPDTLTEDNVRQIKILDEV